MVAGILAWITQLKNGMVQTNLSNSYTWGLYGSALAFFVGNAAGGLVLSSSIYMFGVKKLKPFAKLGAATAFANVTAAMFVTLADTGVPHRFYMMFLHPNFSSPLVWDMIILSLYAVVSLIYLYVLMLPDLKGESKREISEKWAHRIAPVALMLAIGIHVITAWVFSTQGARDWWFTGILAPDFVAVAVAAGTTVVLLAGVLLCGSKDKYQDAYRTMVSFITVAFAVHLFLMYNEFIIKLWYGAEHSVHVIGITLYDYTATHILEVAAPLLAIVLLSNRKVLKNATATVVSCILLLVGVFAHRFLIMPAAFEAIPLTFTPIGAQDTLWSYPISSGRLVEGMGSFITKWDYLPSGTEIIIVVAVMAYVYFLVSLATYLLPIVETEG